VGISLFGSVLRVGEKREVVCADDWLGESQAANGFGRMDKISDGEQ
jgi:hypothetical protein